jgi:hypothetical protein
VVIVVGNSALLQQLAFVLGFIFVVVVGQHDVLVLLLFLVHEAGVHENLLALFPQCLSDGSLELVFDSFEVLGRVVDVPDVFQIFVFDRRVLDQFRSTLHSPTT